MLAHQKVALGAFSFFGLLSGRMGSLLPARLAGGHALAGCLAIAALALLSTMATGGAEITSQGGAAAIFAFMGAAGLLIHDRAAVRARDLKIRLHERTQERNRVARELHDTVMQTILASKHLADDASRVGDDPAKLRAVLERLSLWLGRAAEEGRAAVDGLRHPAGDISDLAAALAKVAEDCSFGKNIEISITASGQKREMNSGAGNEVLRICAEAARNALVHSNPSRLQIQIDYGPALKVRVRDDGCGIEPELLARGRAGHFGLTGMRERTKQIAGKLKIHSGVGGTEVKLQVPGAFVYQGMPEPAVRRRRSAGPASPLRATLAGPAAIHGGAGLKRA